MAYPTWNSCGGRTRPGRSNATRRQAPRLLSVTCLALMSYSQDSDSVECGIETIESQISSCLPRDDEFTNLIIYSSSDVRMCFENADCASDAIKRLRRSLGRGLQQELDNTLKVGECLVRVGYLRHCAGLGLVALRPAILAFR